jgi:hypothetical protein
MSPNSRRIWLVRTLAMAVVCAGPVYAIDPVAVRLSGTLAGRVVDAAGIPQMGAAVMLFNRYDRNIAKIITGEQGLFSFDALTP